MATLNPYGYFEKAVVKKLWGQLSKDEQNSQIRAYQRVNAGRTEKETRKALSDQRRRGRLFRYGTQANEEQAARTIVYQDRATKGREVRKRLGHMRQENAPFGVSYRRPKDSPYTQDQYKEAEILAYRNMRRYLGDYERFNDKRVKKNLSTTSMEWLVWIGSASEYALVTQASVDDTTSQFFSPLFYH